MDARARRLQTDAEQRELGLAFPRCVGAAPAWFLEVGLSGGNLSAHMDDGWWFLWDDPSLSVYEKAMGQAIYRRQYRGNAVALTREAIARSTSMSRRQVIRCEESLSLRGMLRIEATRHRHVFLYRIGRTQLDLFDRGKIFERAMDGSEENAVDNNEITARLADASADAVPTRHARPPDCACQAQIETQNLIKPKPKTRAEVRPRDPLIPIKTEEEQRRRIEARDARVGEEIELVREVIVGGLDTDPVVLDGVRRIARKMESLRPLTEREYEQRKREQLAELRKRGFGR